MSHVTCRMSHVMCDEICVTCHMTHVIFFFLTNWSSLSVEGLLSMGPTLSSLVCLWAWTLLPLFAIIVYDHAFFLGSKWLKCWNVFDHLSNHLSSIALAFMAMTQTFLSQVLLHLCRRCSWVQVNNKLEHILPYIPGLLLLVPQTMWRMWKITGEPWNSLQYFTFSEFQTAKLRVPRLLLWQAAGHGGRYGHGE